MTHQTIRTTLPTPDTHCIDEDTGNDVWSYSKELMHSYAAAWLERALDVCDDIEEKRYYGYENPNTFQDAKWKCVDAIRALIKEASNA